MALRPNLFVTVYTNTLYVDITKMPGPHADTARVMPGSHADIAHTVCVKPGPYADTVCVKPGPHADIN